MIVLLLILIIFIGALFTLFGLGFYAFIWALTLPMRLIIEALKGLF